MPRGIATYFGSISTNGTLYAAANVMPRSGFGDPPREPALSIARSQPRA
jgi:hypothetical protein